jgi:cytidine deaminase
MSVCAEPIALGRAILDGDGSVATIVALRHPKPDESDRDIAIVPPCGACREMLLDFDPDAMVIVPAGGSAAKLPVRALLALPYRR